MLREAWYDEAYTMIFTGVRAGELYALAWEDIDEAAGVVHIRHAVWRGVLGTTKTDDPREVALVEPLRQVLTARRRRMVAEQHPGLETGLIFPSSTGGYRYGHAINKVLEECRLAADIPSKVSTQVLRRTLNTLLLEAGIPAVVIQKQLGHCSDAMTSRYAGVHAEVKRKAVGLVVDLVTKAG
jgi:integrase